MRKLLKVISWLSLIACVGIALIWARSYWREDHISIERTNGVFVASGHGLVAMGSEHTIAIFGTCESNPYIINPIPLANHLTCRWVNAAISLDPDFGAKRIGWHDWEWNYCHDGDVIHSGDQLIFPYWLLVVLFAATPFFRLFGQIRASRRYSSGCCQQCGYDLRATPDRCPECGTPHGGTAGLSAGAGGDGPRLG